MYESFKENRTIIYKPNSVFVLPYKFDNGSAVVYNNRLHILGGRTYSDGESLKHYSWDGNSWRSESTLPYNFYGGAAVVFNNEIHILGSEYDDTLRKKHYAWNGSSWRNVSTLPVTLYDGKSVIYSNKIHTFGFGSDATHNPYHYSFNGTSWQYESELKSDSLTIAFSHGISEVLGNKIHVIAGSTDYITWDGTSWETVNTHIIYNVGVVNGTSAVYNGYIYILGGGLDSFEVKACRRLQKILSTTATTLSNILPCDFFDSSAVKYKDCLYCMGGHHNPKVLLNVSSLNMFV